MSEALVIMIVLAVAHCWRPQQRSSSFFAAGHRPVRGWMKKLCVGWSSKRSAVQPRRTEDAAAGRARPGSVRLAQP